MKTYINYIRKIKKLILISMTLILCLCSCEDFLEPETPLGQIEQTYVFNDENTAIAAVTSMYGKMRGQGFISGGPSGSGYIFGLYADEIDYYWLPGFPVEAVYLHQILPSNSTIQGVWEVPYSVIYSANAILEGLESTNELSNEIKNQLRGEALFVRGLSHFYLVNIFGDVPYVTTSDYTENSTVSRLSINEVYDNIVEDLLESKSLLGNNFINAERVRPNSYVVSALLARIYLYQENWSKAETESSNIINNSSLFSLESDLNKVFLKESTSTIWQFKPQFEGENTSDGEMYIFSDGPPPFSALNPDLVQEMDDNDLRKLNWIGRVSTDTETWYFPFKYKEDYFTSTSVEYSKVFRLAEQYLIRAEARAMLGDITGAKQDINIIRNRAGLQNTQTESIDELKNEIIKERRFELFTEHGHRWFDIRRTGKANEVLGPIKAGWKNTNILLPIPESELIMNPNLKPQNPGY